MPLEHSQFGHYQLLHPIGTDETGAVYLAQDVRAPRQVAVKMLRTDDISQENTSEIVRRREERFEQEIQTLARLDHPHIQPILDFGTERMEKTSYAYVVTPYRLAGSLANWLTQTGSDSGLPLPTIAGLLAQLGEALFYAHEHGILHQDIKPANILLRADAPPSTSLPDLVLSDFSIARLFATHSSRGLSQSAYVRGTSLFLAPEQWDGNSVPASDQYALAILAFYLLTGTFPFQGSLSQVIRQHYQTPAPAPGSLNAQLDPAIDNIIQRALAKEPEKRFPSILDFAQAFAPFQGLSDALPLSQMPSDIAAVSGQTSVLSLEQTVQRPQTPSPLAVTAAPLAQDLSQDALITQNQQEAATISPSLPARASADATRIASKPALLSPDEAPGASKPALTPQASTDETSIESKSVQPSPDETLTASNPAQASTDETLIGSKSAPLAQASFEEMSVASKPVQPSPDETLIANKPAAALSETLPPGSNESAPTAFAANTAGPSEVLSPGSNGVAPTVLASNAAAPVFSRSAPPLPILQFHEPQTLFQLLAIQRKSVSSLQKSLVIALIVLIVLATSGTFLFKNLAGHSVSAASSKSNGNSPQANETMQVGQPLSGSGGINMITVTPTPTNIPTPTTTTPGSQPRSAPGSQPGSTPGPQPGSTPGATSTQVPGGSTSPTPQPTSPAATSTARPTATSKPQPRPTATPKPQPRPTPKPTPKPVCPPSIEDGNTGSWVSSLQTELNARGITDSNGHKLMVDGQFGPLTESAVKKWQTREKIGVDGIVGPITWHTLGNC